MSLTLPTACTGKFCPPPAASACSLPAPGKPGCQPRLPLLPPSFFLEFLIWIITFATHGCTGRDPEWLCGWDVDTHSLWLPEKGSTAISHLTTSKAANYPGGFTSSTWGSVPPGNGSPFRPKVLSKYADLPHMLSKHNNSSYPFPSLKCPDLDTEL